MNTSEQIERFQEFIETSYKEELNEIIRKGQKSLIIDFTELSKFDPDLAEELLNEPEEITKSVELSLEAFDLPKEIKNIKSRFKNLPKTQEIAIKDIRSIHINKFIAIEGIVRQASDVRPQIVSAKFECPTCGSNISILQLDTRFKEPSRCSRGRRAGFRLLNKELVDTQRLIIEESPDSLEGGAQPKRISVFLKEDLVDPKMEKKTTPGSKIKVNGVVKEIQIMLGSGVKSIRFDLVIESNFIEPIEETFEDIDITKDDIKQIKELAADPKVYEKFVNSIAPSVFGHEDIKGALVLQLMGGVRKEKPDGTVTRGDMHILLVGDPGAAKSTLLNYMTKVAPKARYAAGSGATGTGLTATVVRDEFLRGWALEAGTLVLANGGFAMIDELDKMSVEDTSALHEALEQQRITISKANIQATLKAQTTVLAAANPQLGRFNPFKPIANQINLPPALINRFDLIFPVRDIPDRTRDTKIATHILNIQQDAQRLKPEIPPNLFKKYIAYTRQNIKPKLTQEAIDEIKNFYINLRNTVIKGDEAIQPIPISARQLEALVRLAEGSARLRLDNKVTKKDARISINLLKHCLAQVGFDPETGQIDIDRISTGITASQRSKIMLIREVIEEIEKRVGKSIPINDIMAVALEKGISEDKVEESIERLKKEGIIFEPRRGFIQRI